MLAGGSPRWTVRHAAGSNGCPTIFVEPRERARATRAGEKEAVLLLPATCLTEWIGIESDGRMVSSVCPQGTTLHGGWNAEMHVRGSRPPGQSSPHAHPHRLRTGTRPAQHPHSQRSRTPLSPHQHHAGTGGRERGLAMLPVPKVWNLMAAEGSRGQPRLLCVPSIFDGDHLTNAAVARKKSVELQSPDLALSSLT